MTSIEMQWMPQGDLTPGQQEALSVRGDHKPEDLEIYREMWGQKVQRLLDGVGPAKARQAMEMSTEHAPNLMAISQESEPRHWGMQIASSDSAESLFNRIDWDRPGILRQSPDESPNLWEILEQLP
ncbi:hypothetical protein WKW80_05860 [Variovorax humicola]|uniref:Uncharacterized protein n=1 Tax=Variovorax humicola TaxID=1769758 RepID=A0ABU8VUR6_9BURK